MLHDETASGGIRDEQPTYTCHHCHSVVVMNQLRTRAREYCMGCDHYICDGCGIKKKLGEPCRPVKQQVDEYLRAAAVIPTGA